MVRVTIKSVLKGHGWALVAIAAAFMLFAAVLVHVQVVQAQTATSTDTGTDGSTANSDRSEDRDRTDTSEDTTATGTEDAAGTATTTEEETQIDEQTATTSDETTGENATSTDEGASNGTTTETNGETFGDAEANNDAPQETITEDTEDNPISITTIQSADVDPSETDTDNSDFDDINPGAGATIQDDDSRPVLDVSATSTEFATDGPELAVETDSDGTGSKTGGTIFTGNASASAPLQNTLNQTRSNVDGPGPANASIILSETDNEAVLTTRGEAESFTGENNADGGEGLATIGTGNAVSTSDVINVVNTNIFNSDGLVLFLNPFFGDGFDLRDYDLSYFFDEGAGASPTQFGCTILTCLNSSALSVLNKNTATVDNDVSVRAETGKNTAVSTADGGASITTGNAYAAANVLNLVNTNFINSSYLVLGYNNFGDLDDDIVLPSAAFFEDLLGNGNALPDLNSSSYVVNNNNNENFHGVTTASAITGNNTATTTGLGHGEVVTGNAYSNANSYTSANQTRVGGTSVHLIFRVYGEWTGNIQGLPAGMIVRETDYGFEIISTGGAPATGGVGEFNSSAFLASSTNVANVDTDVNVWALTGENMATTEDGDALIQTGDAYAAANVVNMVNTNIVGRNMIFAVFTIFGDWSGDIAFGGHSPDLTVDVVASAPNPALPDGEVDYRFTVTNNGDVAASGVKLNAEYDTGLLTITRGDLIGSATTAGREWNLGTLGVGESKEVNVTGQLRVRNLPTGFSILVPLEASVTSNERDQNNGDNADSVVVTVAAPAGGSSSGGGSSGGGSSGGSGGGGDTGGSGGSGGTDTSDGNTGEDTRGTDDRRGGTDGSSGGVGGNPEGDGGGAPPPGGGGGGGGGGAPVGGAGFFAPTFQPPSSSWMPDPEIVVTKTASVSTTTAPTIVDYAITVVNGTSAGPAYASVLSDTMYDPTGKVLYSRSWDLATVEPGDEISLTYSVEFAQNTRVGYHRNEAVVTGLRNNSDLSRARAMIPVLGAVEVQFLPNGLDLDEEASVPEVSDPTINVVKKPKVCEPYLTRYMKPGLNNNPDDVRKLQTFLASDPEIYPEGLVTGYFGALTTKAVKAFQLKYADEILEPWGITAPTGNVYSTTLKKINELSCPPGTTLPDDWEPEPLGSGGGYVSSGGVSRGSSAGGSSGGSSSKDSSSGGGGLINAIGAFLNLW